MKFSVDNRILLCIVTSVLTAIGVNVAFTFGELEFEVISSAQAPTETETTTSDEAVVALSRPNAAVRQVTLNWDHKRLAITTVDSDFVVAVEHKHLKDAHALKVLNNKAVTIKLQDGSQAVKEVIVNDDAGLKAKVTGVTGVGTVNVRAAATTEYPILDVLAVGDLVTVMGKAESKDGFIWRYVEYDKDKFGWIRTDLITVQK